MNDLIARLRALDLSAFRADDVSLLGISFAQPYFLLLLLLLPLWSWWRRRRVQEQEAIPFSRVAALVAGPKPKISWQRLLQDGAVTYPCTHEGDAGERVVFTEQFPTKTGRARFVPADIIPEIGRAHV